MVIFQLFIFIWGGRGCHNSDNCDVSQSVNVVSVGALLWAPRSSHADSTGPAQLPPRQQRAQPSTGRHDTPGSSCLSCWALPASPSWALSPSPPAQGRLYPCLTQHTARTPAVLQTSVSWFCSFLCRIVFNCFHAGINLSWSKIYNISGPRSILCQMG